MAGKKGMKRYPIEVRVKAIDMYFEKGYCRKEILETLGIKNDTQIEDWFRRFRKEGYSGLEYRKKVKQGRRKDDKADKAQKDRRRVCGLHSLPT